jgi:hypothetical protein
LRNGETIIKQSQILFSITLISGLLLTGCSSSAQPTEDVSATKLSGSEACQELEVRLGKVNDLFDIILDNYEDAGKVIRAGGELRDAASSIMEITSEEQSVEVAIVELGRTSVVFGQLLSDGYDIFGPEVSAATDDMQFAGIDAAAVCDAY